MSILHPKEYLVLPHELSYAPKTHDRGLVFTKQTVKLFPETPGVANPGDTTTFSIRHMAKAIDPRSIQLHFAFRTSPTLVASSSQSTDSKNPYVVVDDSAHSMLKTVTVRLGGGFTQDRTTDYNRCRNFMGAMTISEPWKRTAQGRAQGYHPRPYDEETARMTAAINANAVDGKTPTMFNTPVDSKTVSVNRNQFIRPNALGYEFVGSIMDTYQNLEARIQGGKEPDANGADSANNSFAWRSIPLDCMGFLAQQKFIYLPAIGGELNIDILWEDVNRCVWVPQAATVSPTYIVGENTSLYLTYDVVSLTEAYVVGLTRALTSGGINFDCEKYYVQKFLPVGGEQTQMEYRIQKRFQSAKSAFVFFNQPVVDGKDYARPNKTSSFSCMSLTRWQFTVDGLPITHPIELEGFGSAQYIDPMDVGPGGVVEVNKGVMLGVQPSGGLRIAEALWELSKALRLDGDVSFATGLTYGNYYNDNDAGQVSINNNRPSTMYFGAGVDLERTGAELSGRGMDEIVFNGTFTPTTGCELYFVVVYDSRLVVEAGSRFTIVE